MKGQLVRISRRLGLRSRVDAGESGSTLGWGRVPARWRVLPGEWGGSRPAGGPQRDGSGGQARLQDGSQWPLSLSETFPHRETHDIQLKLYCGDHGEGSVGTAKGDHVISEAGQVLAPFLIFLILAFIGLRPHLHPCVLPDDVVDPAGGWGDVRRGGRPVRGRAGEGWAGAALGMHRAGTHLGFSPHRSVETPHTR